MEYTDHRFPSDVQITGDVYLVMQKAYSEFINHFGKKYAFENFKYSMFVTKYEQNGGYWVVSIMPEMGGKMEDWYFGSDRDEETGEYPNGGSMTFYFSLHDLNLLKKHFMR